MKKLQKAPSSKKVIWLMVDSMMAHAIDQGIENGDLPALSYLTKHGHYQREVVSPFPTMSVTIDSSILTGTYPDQHRVPGLIWYDETEKRVVNYGTGLGEIIRDGTNQFLKDAIIHLNQKHLNTQTPTLYEDLADRGITSASINGLIYRGKTDHTLSFPAWISAPTSLPRELPVKGPDFLTFGAFANPLEGKVSLPDGITRSFGFSDPFPLEVTRYLIKKNRLPDFSFVYFSDADHSVHKKGPSDLSGLKKFDKELQSLLDSFGSWEKALNEAVWILSGDSGQTGLKSEKKEAVVRLDQHLKQYNQLAPGQKATPETDLVLCVNERMAYVYTLNPSIRERELVDVLKGDSRIDLISWKENEDVHVLHAGQDKKLQFRPGGPWQDPYRQKWEIRGDIETLDLQEDPREKQLTYGEYPDPLSRLWGAHHSHPGRFLVVNVRPGYELAIPSSPTHLGGGGHGSLHQTDSLIPCIITGTDQRPEHWRLVDFKDFLIRVLTQKPESPETL
ncbi:phosphodiesterase [Paludifilum halophilum]|uniref:Phosphodiesterase n=2 Tax=Paludifilum halophilum TaxID=1642702 RepID=A0A235BDB9_9BACL|nr:phosphodiesterase [Paludifilum halophilum]